MKLWANNSSTMTGQDTEKGKEIEGSADFDTAINETGYGKYNIVLMSAVIFCIAANTFDTTCMSYVIPFAECDLQLTNFNKGMLNAITYAGMISSAFLWGFISDTLGRKNIFVTGYFIHGCIGIASSFSQSFTVMLVLRFFSGFMGNGPYVVVMSYLSEMHAGQYRSRTFMVTGTFFSIMSITLPGIAWGIIPNTWSFELFGGYIKYSSWNVFIAVCSLPSILAGTLMSFFEESPKYLMSQGRNDEALKIFQKVYSMNTGNPPEMYPVKHLVEEKKQVVKGDPHKSFKELLKLGWQQFVPLFKHPHALHALLIFSIQTFCFFGLNTIRLWYPQIFSIMEDYNILHENTNSTFEPSTLCEVLMYTNKEISNRTDVAENITAVIDEELSCFVNLDKSVMYSNSMISGAVNMAFTICGSLLINYVSKKKFMIASYMIAILCGILLQWATSFPFLVSAVSIFMAQGTICITCLTSVVVEVFPTTLRAMAVSLNLMFGRLAALIGNLLFPILLEWNCVVPFYMVAAAMLVSCCLSFLLPDTKGRMT